MPVEKNIAIVWANPYSKNLGVGALAYSALSLVYDIASENRMDVNLYCFGSHEQSLGCVVLKDERIEFMNIRGFDFYNWKSIIKRFLFPSRLQFSEIKKIDYVFDIAEGDSFTDIYGKERFWRILNSKRYFSGKVKAQVLMPQTIGPFNLKTHEKAAFETMKKLDLVISRDRKSYDYTTKFLPQEMITEAIDVAFYLPFIKRTVDNGKINVGINISGLLWNGGYTKNNQFGMKSDYCDLVKRIIEYFYLLPDVQIHLISHVIPMDFPVEDDYAVSEHFTKQYPKVILSPRFETPIDAKSYISGMDFFTGSRMHACIAAFSSGVPVFPMAYSRKFNGLFEGTLGYKWMGDCVNETTDDILSRMVSAYEKRDVLRVEVQSANDNIVHPRLIELKRVILSYLNKY